MNVLHARRIEHDASVIDREEFVYICATNTHYSLRNRSSVTRDGTLTITTRYKVRLGLWQYPTEILTLSKDYVAGHLHFCINITCIIIVYTSRSYSGDTKLTNECNAGCGCSTQSYEPLCGMDGSIYFTPCHAGCEANYTMIEGPMGPFKASTVDSFSPVYISHNRSPSSPRDQNTKKKFKLVKRNGKNVTIFIVLKTDRAVLTLPWNQCYTWNRSVGLIWN